MQLRLQLPGEKLTAPPVVWCHLEPDVQAAFIRVLAKAMVKEIEAMQKEKPNGELRNDRECEDQANALGTEFSNICKAIDGAST
jgi:hypothetical protein